MTQRSVSPSELQSHLWEAANILRGPVDAADFKTYVFPLLFFKRLSDVHDEEHASPVARQEEVEYRVNGLEKALGDWLESSRRVRKSLRALLEK